MNILSTAAHSLIVILSIIASFYGIYRIKILINPHIDVLSLVTTPLTAGLCFGEAICEYFLEGSCNIILLVFGVINLLCTAVNIYNLVHYLHNFCHPHQDV